jgi:hypothetical protein
MSTESDNELVTVKPTFRPKNKSKKSTMLKLKPTRKKKGIRTYISMKASQYKTFTDLCETDIMNTPLEFVAYKSWLSKGKVNIFIIGEVHSYRNYTEKGIFEMFTDFKTYMDSVGFLKEMFTVDIMLEISEGHTNRDMLDDNMFIQGDDQKQMNNVRALFRECIGKHNCGKIRAHWVDNMMFSEKDTYKTSTKFTYIPPELASAPPSWLTVKPEARKALKAMPEWLKKFYDDYEDESINFPEKFQTDEDLLKLLDENTIVLKEIDKAAKIQKHKDESPIFDRDFAKSILIKMNESLKGLEYNRKVFHTARTIMDIYTVARMIKLSMTNVIIYVGANHAKRIVFILTELGYEINRLEERDVGKPLDEPFEL